MSSTDFCDLVYQLRAFYFPRDRDITLQTGRIFDGLGTVPIGAIMLWSGSVVSIPTGYQICDGTNGTPDLRDKFLVGAGSSYAVGATGGSDTVDLSHTHGPGTLATDTVADHTHTVNFSGQHHHTGSTGSESAHTHGVGTYAVATHTHGTGTLATGNESAHTHSDGTYASANDTHNHDVTGTSGAESSHTHGPGTLATGDPTSDEIVQAGSGDTVATAYHHHDNTAGGVEAWSGATAAGSSHSHSDGTYAAANDTHNHDVTGTSGAGSAHNHSLSGETESIAPSFSGTSGAGSAHSHTIPFGGNHAHGGATGAGGTHSHTVTSGVTGTGGSAAHDNRPQFYSLAFIQRTS